MDAVRNPFSLGAGYPPPVVAGRQHPVEKGEASIECLKRQRLAQFHALVGLEGVGHRVFLIKAQIPFALREMMDVTVRYPCFIQQ